MVDDFIVCVERITACACCEPAKGSRAGESGGGVRSEDAKMTECRICQEEEEELAMEAPCACSGSLKFAHRKCIQRWCNKKGDIICEICNQAYAPNYSIPQGSPSSDSRAIEIRQGWGSEFDLEDPRFLAIAVAEHQLLQAENEDYTVANSGGIACCRSVAVVLMILLFLRHALVIVTDLGQLQDASTFFSVYLLELAGFLLPCYVLVRALYIIHGRRRRQARLVSMAGIFLTPIWPRIGGRRRLLRQRNSYISTRRLNFLRGLNSAHEVPSPLASECDTMQAQAMDFMLQPAANFAPI